MITFIFITFVKSLSESLTIRYVFASAILLLFLFLLFQSILSMHQKSKKVLLTLADVALIFEIICCVIFFLPAMTMELEYVGQFDVQFDVQTDESITWDILMRVDNSKRIEVFLPPVEINNNTIDLDTDQYEYLFVYGSNNVSLSYSFWDMEFNNTIPPRKIFFWGHLSSSSEIFPGKVYVFRFQRPLFPIARYGIQ